MNLPRLSHRVVARQQGRFLLAHRAQALEMDAVSFRDLLRRVECDELFRRLTDAGSEFGGLITRRPLARMRGLASAAPEELERATAGDSGFDLGRTLAEHAEGVDALRRLGFARARALLESEDLEERRSRLSAWGADPEDSQRLLALLEHLSVFGAMAALSDSVLVPSEPCTLIARLEPGPEGFAIVPLVSYFRRERYVIAYDRIAQARREGRFSETQAKRLPALLAEIEAINFRGDTLHKVLCGLADAHGRFLRSGRETDLEPLTQLDLARAIGSHPSAVCRAMAGRSLLTPWGQERSLSAFFPGRKSHNARAVASLLSEDPQLSDREVAQRLRERFGLRISRRSAALYRRGLAIPNSYRRRRLLGQAEAPVPERIVQML